MESYAIMLNRFLLFFKARVKFMEFAVALARDFSSKFWDQRFDALLQSGAQVTRDRCYPFHYVGNIFPQDAPDRAELFEDLRDALSAGFWPLATFNDVEDFARQNVLECEF